MIEKPEYCVIVDRDTKYLLDDKVYDSIEEAEARIARGDLSYRAVARTILF